MTTQAPRRDYSGSIVATGRGLLVRTIIWGSLAAGLWILIVAAMSFPWILLILLVPVYFFVDSLVWESKQRKRHAAQHLARYGRPPRPYR